MNISLAKKALICGVGGQDGSLLSKFLLEKGYEVWGTSRDAQSATFGNLHLLGIFDKINYISMAPNDFRSVLSAIIKSKPDEVYFLAAQSSVGLSFDQPVETIESITLGTLNILEAIRFLDSKIKFYHASSSECFGDVGKIAATETTPFRPRSPYAVAKASAHWLVANYRDSYGLFASNGILFNHESLLRPNRFVTKKIVTSASRIASGSNERLILGRLDIFRDWGWAPEYVEGMWKILQHHEPDDFIISTGETNSLNDFVAEAFALHDLDWKEYVDKDSSLFRPNELEWSQGSPEKAAVNLGWIARSKMKTVIKNMTNLDHK